ncbi:hypothetical protein niasHT_025230 [Heterodera trifolii]|uniref:F-box domain-containing protein n=1 Tax=Heterodera trifolii TaxID=157864 RepID=A0ABD2JGN0_9BILA
MSDRRKEAEANMAKSIFISGDGWLAVFDLLPPSQLGLEIATISHRFNTYVDEHFKTRKWALKFIQIRREIGKKGTKKLELAKLDGEKVQIPQKPMPKNVVGFEAISIRFIDQNALTFLCRFRRLFTSSPIVFAIGSTSDRILMLILEFIWPMFNKNIGSMHLMADTFMRLRMFESSFLSKCPSLRVVKFCDDDNFFIEFPADDNAAASDGQVVAKWLFTALPDNVPPKMLKCSLDKDDGFLGSDIEDFKEAFAEASSAVNFIFVVRFPPSFAKSVVPFSLINELTQEQLTLKTTSNSRLFVFVRSPIERDASEWTKWENEAIGWDFLVQLNRIDVYMYREDQIGDGLLNKMIGPINRTKK